MNTTKTSTSLFTFSAAVLMTAAIGASSTAFAAEAKVDAPRAKVVAAKASDKVDAKALKRKAKLPKKWVWKKYAKNFDSMYRK